MHKLLKQAFTLIELLVVIAIIGILSGLIVVAMGGLTNSANIAKYKVFSDSLRNALLMNLVSEWKFDGSGVADGSASTTAYTQDTWSGGNSCSIGGSPLVYSGSNCINGSCLSFNGSSDYLNCGNGSSLDVSSGITIEAWIMKKGNNSLPYGGIVGKHLFGQPYGEYGFNIYDSGYIAYSIDTTGTDSSDYFSTPIAINKWYYLVLTYDSSSSTTKFYINGIVYSSPVASGTIVATSAQNLYIGVAGGFFNGLVDNVRVYGAATPTSLVEERYYSGLNSLLAKGGITKQDYQNRIGELSIRL